MARHEAGDTDKDHVFQNHVDRYEFLDFIPRAMGRQWRVLSKEVM